MDSLAIPLPAAPSPARRPPLPFMAAVVPVAAGVVLWLVTGSVYALCFAALGPLMIGASFLDSARTRRRERRRGEAQTETDWARAEEALDSRQQEERETLWRLHPDASSCIAEQPLRGTTPPDAETGLVLGSGTTRSAIRCSDSADARGRSFRERCAVLEDAPLVAPLGGGVCLRGPAPVVAAVARALVVQVCLRYSAAQVSLVGGALETVGLAGLPHAVHARRSGFRLGLVTAGSDPVDADAVIWMTATGAEVPEGITTVIDVIDPGRATLRTPQRTADVAVECLSHAQAAEVARECLVRGGAVDVVPAVVALHHLEQPPTGRGLPVAIGRSERGEVVVDIVDDGPHAIVTGTTGTGKSELLVTWITAIAARNGPDRVAFVLADFKGGTAFEPLRGLKQVAAVITDLDAEGARRGVSSLTAELRRREGVLAAAGARDVSEVAMPRLIIVVDEFAALLQEHPDLGAVFTDIAARGRALGMHLMIGTQRAAGVVRDSLAANCPLRISLRVGDAADSRLVIGTTAASELPGGADSRGLGLVRRPHDRDPVALRIALTQAADLRRVGMRWAGEAAPPSPWLPPLPSRLALGDLRASAGGEPVGIVLGRADDPERQSQPLETLLPGVDRGLAVLGSAGSGRSMVLRALAAQEAAAHWVPRDAEAAWDLVSAWTSGDRRMPALVLCDDLDALLADLPPEYAQQFVHRWEQVLRSGTGTTVVLTAARAHGPLGRVLDALPRRALLRLPTRVDHLAAGGEASGFLRDRAPGRARMGDREVQFACVEEDSPGAPPVEPPAAWRPSRAITAVVTPAAGAVAALLRAAHPDGGVSSIGPVTVPTEMSGIVVGDTETWQRNWSAWQRVRTEGEILIRAEHPADLRQLAGVRELPPYARLHAGRAWSLVEGEPPRRVVLPELGPRRLAP